jgi:sugar lactone lactonase YvrE
MKVCCQTACSAMLALGIVFGRVDMSRAAEYIVTDQANGRVIAIDAESGTYSRTLVSGLFLPSAISWGPNDSLYVTDLMQGLVLRVNPASGVYTVFASGLDKPGSLAFDEWNNTLYVGEFGNFQTFEFGDQVFTYSADGTQIAAQTVNAGPTGHAGLAIDAGGNLYVSGFATDQNASGHVTWYSSPWEPDPLSPLGVFAPSPAPSPLLQGAAGIAFDSDGDLFVAGLIAGGDGALVKYTVDGVVVGETLFDADIAFPSGMTLLPDGSLVVTSLGAGGGGTLYKYNTETGDRVNLLAGAFAGDYNDDLMTDAADLDAWETAYGGMAGGDADGDGDSDGTDFLAWQRGLGAPGGFSPSGVVWYEPTPAAASAVPEPGAAIVAMTLGLGGVVGRRRRKRNS